jgi:hypothetical protein
LSEAAAASDLTGGAAPAAPAAAPVYRPEGFPVTPAAFHAPEAVAARAEIETLKADKQFYETLQAEKDRGGPAHQKWAELHARGFPAPTAVASQDDVNAQANARNEQQWNTFFSGLRQQWSITPEQEAEMRAGVIREDLHKLALEQRALMIKDKAFYRRLLDGDMAAKEKWSRTIAAISLRPVKAA